MSAFLVSHNTMHDVVAEILDITDGLRYYVSPERGTISKFADASVIGRKLFEMNHQALHARYGEPVPAFETIRYVFQPRKALPSRVARLKAMECFLYQCMEGDVDKSELFAEVERIAGRTAMKLVNETSAWVAAPWGRH